MMNGAGSAGMSHRRVFATSTAIEPIETDGGSGVSPDNWVPKKHDRRAWYHDSLEEAQAAPAPPVDWIKAADVARARSNTTLYQRLTNVAVRLAGLSALAGLLRSDVKPAEISSLICSLDALRADLVEIKALS